MGCGLGSWTERGMRKPEQAYSDDPNEVLGRYLKMRTIRAFALAVCLLNASCNLTNKHWTYRITREAASAGYWSFAGGDIRTERSDNSIGGDDNFAVIFIGAVLLLPPVLDTAFLPIAGLHDLFFVD